MLFINFPALDILDNYPDNILIKEFKQENGKYKGYMYLTGFNINNDSRGDGCKKLIFSTPSTFELENEAITYLKETCENIMNNYE